MCRIKSRYQTISGREDILSLTEYWSDKTDEQAEFAVLFIATLL